MPRYIVDPVFPERMRALRRERGLSYRQLARRAPYTHTYLWQVETGQRPATPQFAALVDTALDAGGVLAGMVHVWDGLTGDDDERLALIVAAPGRLDVPGLEAIARLQARVRRLEDEIGSPAVMEPVLTRLQVVENLAVEARGPLRPRVVAEAAQWAQLGGWLHVHVHADYAAARRWYATALELAMELSDASMISTVLNMRGQIAWMQGNPDATAAFAAAARNQAATPGILAMAEQLQARVAAELGDAAGVERAFDRAAALLARAVEHGEDEPSWNYFYSADHLALQRGLAYGLLGEHARAAEVLRGHLDALPPEIRAAEWMAYYVLHLGLAEAGRGDREAAVAALDEAASTAEVTGSARLALRVGEARDRIADGC